ncbi:methionyl-tRNA formyltransferase [Jeotgalibacillus haloalkalitolerans]|uniref:Methionyl-tRNA formyltransferase n=1 Tax=Jeotgalibacillus haloalkalitolerans TaxID=3104292 RepID=A0ABU5KK22_9BACL|nr:methionyl-tRNA formyltransferase [Jeotgalibacillus sp. HH7-29]MDZ5711604.1 methionyl-tRNA formyltransferase [Jeotgalibacillus sp. HH7-29]
MTSVIFMGTPDFSVPVLQRVIADGYEVKAVVTQPDRPVGRKKILTPPPVKKEALKSDLKVIQPEKLSGSAELDEIIALDADLIITAAFGQLLPKKLLEAPKLGCINVHASLLPELRGGAPIHHAIIRGYDRTGITIMYMAEKLDAGDIISQREVSITDEDHVGTLHDKLSETGADLLSETLPLLIEGKAERTEQNHEQATYAWNIKREEEKIDWNRPGRDVFNQIRGLYPWPTAYTIFRDKPLKIQQARLSKGSGAPGEIIHVSDEGILFAAADDEAVLVTELQPSGKKKMPAADFLRGSNIGIGEKAQYE